MSSHAERVGDREQLNRAIATAARTAACTVRALVPHPRTAPARVRHQHLATKNCLAY
jgi:hypothetical protein